MTTHPFINIHVLISHSPSCLNRDDMQMQKSATFGGVRRVRISSQCLKRAMRTSEAWQQQVGHRSVRSNHLGQMADYMCEQLAEKFPADLVRDTVGLIGGKSEVGEDTKADAVAPWCVAEVARLCQVVQAAREAGDDDKKIAKTVAKDSKALNQAMAQTPDIALFGRMATSGIMSHVDAACAVAHSITTHATDADLDWFSAVDDLVQEEGETGAGHLGTQEFSAGVFYRYASLDLRQLAENLGTDDADQVLDLAANIVRLLATVVPTGKQNSFAAYNPADLVLASFTDLPLSAANAFEKPVQADLRGKDKGGFLAPSIAALQDYLGTVAKGYGVDGPQCAFSLWPTTLQPRAQTLADLEAWVRNAGE